ncbi:MAG: PD40 domain-containing protein [Saprospiraceae bacterium]|nr:PD40 domain-containing protein [Saprospiraceae bacterium]
MKSLFTILFLSLVINLLQAQPGDVYCASHPTLTPDAQAIIFAYEGDLWRVNTNGGMASRLTAMEGNETYPRVSPDGKWIAFTSSQYTSQDVFVMPTEGGEIRQLTCHEAFDQVDSWSWDSKFIYFTSNRYNRNSAYKVALEGGTPMRIFGNYFNTVHTVVEAPNGEIFFNETWESRSSANRKRYKGAYNPDIQSYNPKTKEFKVYTDWIGKDFWYTIDRKGSVYFVSDEANGEYNLYELDGNKKKQLTKFETSIKIPQISANGDKIVFEKDYQLWIYDVKSKRSEKVKVQIFDNETLAKTQDFQVKTNIENFDVSPDGKKLAFVSRGKLFAADIKGQFVQILPTNSRGRVLEVSWLSDNKTLIYNMTNANGYSNWFSIAADGSAAEKQITNVNKNDRQMVLNHNRSKGVYISGRDEVRLMDLKNMMTELLVKDEIWGYQNPTPSFSPDGEYVMFTAHRNFEQDIFVYHLKSKTTTNLTNTGVTETNPFWSPDGKSIYFVSNRLKASYPYGNADAKIYKMPLEKMDDPYKSAKYEDLFVADSLKKKEEKKDSVKIVTPASINPEGLMRQLEQVSPNFGTQAAVYITQKDEKTTVIFTSNHDEGRFNWWKVTYEPFENPKTEKIEGASTGGISIVESSGKMYALINGDICTVNLDGKKVEKIDISYTFRKNLADEFTQMFYETWANMEENFYNETFHGTDWAGMKQRYAALLPHLDSRSDLRVLINDMLGELNSSHLGFNSSGQEENIFYKTRTAETGIIFKEDAPYTVQYIVNNSAADKKDKDIRAGDVLAKANGTPVNPAIGREFYFTQPSLDEELSLTFKRGSEEYTVKIHPQSYGSLNNLLYDEWIDNNQRIVDEKGKKRVAYAPMRHMGGGELNSFLIDMTNEAYQREGLILDLRFNTGGNVHDDVLRFLSQRPYLKWKYREGAFTLQSNFAPAASPMVLLVNEQSLSDAEMTATGFKHLGLGKIVGTETYRWIIFTSGKGLVDGSFYRLPSWGCYTLDGKNIEQEGVKPDIFVKTTFKDRLEGRDPQLDRAIEEVMKGLK